MGAPIRKVDRSSGVGVGVLIKIVAKGTPLVMQGHDFFKARTKKQVEISVFMYNTSGNHCGNI